MEHDKVLTAKEYSELLRFRTTDAFYASLKRHPEDFCKPFTVGRCKRWFLSSVLEFHKTMQNVSKENLKE